MGFPAPFGRPCTLSRSPHPCSTGKAPHPLRPLGVFRGESTAGKAPRPCSLWGSLCPLGGPSIHPPAGKVPCPAPPGAPAMVRGFTPLRSAPLHGRARGGARGCGELVGSPKNVPVRLRDMGFGPSRCLLGKSLGVAEMVEARRCGAGRAARLGTQRCLQPAPRRGGDVLPSSLETKVSSLIWEIRDRETDTKSAGSA